MEEHKGDSGVDIPQREIMAEPESLLDIADNPQLPRWRFVLLAISLCIGLFLSLLDTTIVATALYTIGKDFNALSSVTWVALGYTLSYLGTTVIFARMADIIGRRNAYASAFVIFFSFSLGCGFAQTQQQLIVCRAFQAVGGAGLYALAFVILTEVSPPKHAHWVHAMTGSVIAMAGVLGPVLGGLLTQYATWRWIFWINPIIGTIPLVFLFVAWPKPHQIRCIPRGSIKQLDIVGSILIIAASVLVLLPLEEAGLKDNIWATPTFIVPLIVGCLCWCLLFGWEFLVDRLLSGRIITMFPLRLLKRPVFMSYVITMLLSGFPYFVIIYRLPLRLEVVNEKTPLMAGVGLLPMLGAVAMGSALGGGLNGTKDRTFLTLSSGAILMMIAAALLSTLKNTSEVESKMYGFQFIFGLGFGLTSSTVSLGVGLECELRDSTVAQGIIAQARILGGSIGIAGSTAMLGAIQQRELASLFTPSEIANLQASATTMTAAQHHAVKQVYSDAFTESLQVSAGVAAACVLATFGTFRRNPLGIQERKRQQMEMEQERAMAQRGAS